MDAIFPDFFQNVYMNKWICTFLEKSGMNHDINPIEQGFGFHLTGIFQNIWIQYFSVLNNHG